jgi:hypothetical protein
LANRQQKPCVLTYVVHTGKSNFVGGFFLSNFVGQSLARPLTWIFIPYIREAVLARLRGYILTSRLSKRRESKTPNTEIKCQCILSRGRSRSLLCPTSARRLTSISDPDFPEAVCPPWLRITFLSFLGLVKPRPMPLEVSQRVTLGLSLARRGGKLTSVVPFPVGHMT